METKALENINCGIFVLTALDGAKHNGCIINTAMQVTTNPLQISITVNKTNYTAEIIEKSGAFNLSCLDESAEFELIKRFGFVSGREADKFANFNDFKTTANDVRYITKGANAMISGKVVKNVDVGTHIIFIAEVTQTLVLSDKPSASYDYYHKNIKPAPPKTDDKNSKTSKWICKVCGYIYEGDELPEDYICPLCKHPASDFELLE